MLKCWLFSCNASIEVNLMSSIFINHYCPVTFVLIPATQKSGVEKMRGEGELWLPKRTRGDKEKRKL
jgi:hypothetical protein